MIARPMRAAVSFVVGLAVVGAAACGSSSEPSGPSVTAASNLAIISGNGQVGLVGTALSFPLVVKVTTNGQAVKGATVSFAVVSGAATVTPTSATTDTAGQAKASVTLGSAAGSVSITATVAGTNLVATFVESAGTSTVTAACASGSPSAPAAGGVVPLSGGTGICLSGGTTGAEYALVAFYGNPDSTASSSVTVRTTGGATAVTTANEAPAFSTAAATTGTLPGTNAAQTSFDAKLRFAAHHELSSRITGARSHFRQSASFVTVPANPTIGTLYQLNAQGNFACTQPIMITARVAAVSNLAIVLADTANPSGGFTDAEYATFGAMFDTLISPIDVSNFGQPSDIDKNGKTLILFTKEVNKLTPKGGLSGGGVIGGFFTERDLFPLTDTPDLQGCAGSNFAEMYYSLVPDPTGRFSDVRTKTDVLNDVPGTLIHEFQHLINAGRRIYVNNADDFEDVWLNEGLSHIAEELLYYHVAGLTPRQNIGASVIGANNTAVNTFNNYQGSNFGRFEVYIGKPTQTSPYAENDELETRGATWYLLRYLADHRGTSDADTWKLLDNSTKSGKANLAGVFGSDIMTQIRNFATAVYADDITGMNDARFLEPSWNMRSIFPALVNSAGQRLNKYPLAVIPVSDGSPATTSIVAGGAGYFRFFVPANVNVSADWTTSGLPTSPFMQFTVVRTR